MRLIDAEKAVENIRKQQTKSIARECAINAVNNTPVEDVAPVVHAHWIESEEELEPDFQLFDMTDLKGALCSECGYEVGADIYVWNYCPNCGAKMDGEASE